MLIILGALILLSPFYGLPMSILSWILPAFGLFVFAIGISFKREQVLRDRTPSYETPVEPAS